MDRGKIREFAVVFIGYTLLTLVLTYPVVLRFTTHFMCDGGDGFQNIWNMWWLKTALTEKLTDPYYTTYLYYPKGVTLLFQTFNPFNGFISIPLQFIFKMEVVYNLVVLFSFIMSGVGMYLLTRYLIGYRPAAFIGGIIYTFCPYHFAHGLGHLQLIAMEWLPFYVLYLIKTSREGGYRNALLAGVFLILTALCSWYYLIDALFFTGIFVIYRWSVGRDTFFESGFLSRLGVALLVFFLVMSPLLVRMIYAKLTLEFTGEHNPEIWSADLTSFFVPSGISTWGRMWFKGIWSKWSGNTAENSNFLGYIVLGLSIYALVYVPKSRFWGIAGVFFWVLALGPYPRIMGNQLRIPLPYLLFHSYLPFFSFTGVPERFDLMLKFCMAIMAAYAVFDLVEVYLPGVNDWLKFYPHPETENARLIEERWQISGMEIAFVTLAGVLICLEYLAIPYTTTRVEVPQFYHQMADQPEEYGVIDIPSGALTLYYATIHQKPLVGGYVSRPSLKALQFLQETPIISTLMADQPPPPPAEAHEALSTLVTDNIRYIITHTDQYRSFLEEVLNLEKIYDGEGIKVYDCRRTETVNGKNDDHLIDNSTSEEEER